MIEDKLNVSIVTRGEDILVSGELAKAEMVEETLFVLLKLVRKGIKISERDIVYAVQLAEKICWMN